MTKKLIKNKNYMLLVIGNFVSLLGSNILQFVMSLYVLELTGSATLFASMLAISILPRILLSPIAGVFGDWFDKKKAIVLLDLVNAFILSMFAIYLIFNDDLTIGLIYLFVVLLETTEIFFHSAMSVVLPSVVEEEQYLEANSLRTMLVSFAQLLAPIFGAMIFGAFGVMVALIIASITFVLSATSEMFIHVPKTKAEGQIKNLKSFKEDLVEGIQLVKRSKSIRTIMSIAVVVNFALAPFFSVGLMFLIKEVLSQSDMRLGLLQTSLGLAMILSPLLLMKKLKQMALGDVLIKGFILMGVLVSLVSISVFPSLSSINQGLFSYLYVLVLCFFIGVLVTAVNISVNTLIQKIVPIEFMGRTSTVLGLLSTIAIPIGQMAFGFLYDAINPGVVMIVNGMIVLLSVALYYQRIKLIDEHSKEEILEEVNVGKVSLNEV